MVSILPRTSDPVLIRTSQSHSHLINAKSELPAFLIKPIQRICKYPLLLEVGNLLFLVCLCDHHYSSRC
jgi:hypothetical protein